MSLGIILNIENKIGKENKNKGQEGRISSDMSCVYAWFLDDSG